MLKIDIEKSIIQLGYTLSGSEYDVEEIEEMMIEDIDRYVEKGHKMGKKAQLSLLEDLLYGLSIDKIDPESGTMGSEEITDEPFVLPIEAAPIIDRDVVAAQVRDGFVKAIEEGINDSGVKKLLDTMKSSGRKCDHCEQPMIRNELEQTWDCMHCGGWEDFSTEEKIPGIDGVIDPFAIKDEMTVLRDSLKATQVALRAVQLKMNAVKVVLQIIAYEQERPFNPRDLAKAALEELEK